MECTFYGIKEWNNSYLAISKISIFALMFFRIVYTIVFISISAVSFGQRQPVKEIQPENRTMENVQGTEKTQDTKRDSVKIRVHAWKLTGDYLFLDSIGIDTVINSFQLFHPAFHHTLSFSDIGNIGSPYVSNLYHQRKSYINFLFGQPYEAYLRYPEKVLYYNTRTPYTRIGYTSGGKGQRPEHTIAVVHSQNINSFLNIGLNFDLYSSTGQYENQKTKNNSLTLFGSYRKKKYSGHVNVNFNSINNSENGGLLSDSLIADSRFAPNELATRLQSAKSELRGKSTLIVNQYNFIKKPEAKDTTKSEQVKSMDQRFSHLSIAHVLKYERYTRRYSDEDPASGFYDHIYLNEQETNDSVYSRRVTNIFSVVFTRQVKNRKSFSGVISLGHELNRYGYLRSNEQRITYQSGGGPFSQQVHVFQRGSDNTYLQYYQNENLSDTYIRFATLNNKEAMFNWNVSAQYFISGYNQGNLWADARLTKRFKIGKDTSTFEIKASVKPEKPDFFLTTYFSNHFKWDFQENIKSQKESRLDVSFEKPSWKLRINSSFSMINNYMYFDTTANPVQHHEGISVLSFGLGKTFRVWKFYSKNNIIYQQTSHPDVLPLPKVTTYMSNYFDFFMLKKVLHIQIGADLFYHTKYDGYAYMPALGVFHLQNEKQLGGYPYVDAFMTVKLKRTRFFVKFDHINSGMSGYDFFDVLHYPSDQRILKFGLSWSFYD